MRTAATPGPKVPTGEIVNGGFRLAPGTTPLAVNTWTHLATTYDGTTLSVVRQRRPGRPAGHRRLDHDLHRRAEDRRQRDLGRVVPRRNRRGPHLQPRPQRQRNHRRHEHVDHRARHGAAQRTRDADRHRGLGQVGLSLGRGDRQRGRRPLQPPPRHERRLHALGGEPDRAADRARATPTSGSQPAPTSTRSPPRTSPATSARPGTRQAASAAADTTPPTVSITAPAARRDGQRNDLRSTRARPTTARSQACSSSSTARTSAPRTRPLPTRSPGTRSRSRTARTRSRAVARDAAGNTTPATNVAVTVSNTGSRRSRRQHGRSTRASGTTTADQSGRGNIGTLAQRDLGDDRQVQRRALLQRHERLGHRARLRHARPDDRDDARGLGAAGGVAGGWRTAIAKEQPGNLAYGLYANTNGTFPGGEISVGGTQRSLERHRRRCPSAPGATSPRPTTARRCGSS